jgi:hypothetical protein
MGKLKDQIIDEQNQAVEDSEHEYFEGRKSRTISARYCTNTDGLCDEERCYCSSFETPAKYRFKPEITTITDIDFGEIKSEVLEGAQFSFFGRGWQLQELINTK